MTFVRLETVPAKPDIPLMGPNGMGPDGKSVGSVKNRGRI
jgi:hypothetical protein